MKDPQRLADYVEHVLEAISRISTYCEDIDELNFLVVINSKIHVVDVLLHP
jgi:hypothetical protein